MKVARRLTLLFCLAILATILPSVVSADTGPDPYGYTIDGQPLEWAGIPVAAVDPSGDTICSPDKDLTETYLDANYEYLYIMQRVVTGDASNGWYHIHLRYDHGSGEIWRFVELRPGSADLLEYPTYLPITDPDTPPDQDVNGALGQVVEVRVPWSLLGYPPEVHISPKSPSLDADPCDDSEWTTLANPGWNPNPIIVTTTDDHDDGSCDGDCTLREALNAAGPGDRIHFDPAFFSPGTIEVDPALGQLTISRPGVRIEASDCDVTLSGAQLGAPTGLLLDDMSLTFGLGSTENQLLNAGFDDGAAHWRAESPSCTVASEPSSHEPAATPSLRWTIQDVAGATSILYDAGDVSVPVAWSAPDFPESSWIPLDGATSIRLRFQYQMTTPMAYAEAVFWLRFQNGPDTFYQPLYYIPLGNTSGWQTWDSGDLPMDPTAQGLALQITAAPAGFAHGLSIPASYVTLRGLEIVDFPGHGVSISSNTSEVSILDSVITGNGMCGISVDLYRVAFLHIHDSVLSYNGGYGLEATGMNRRANYVRNNRIEGNGLGGIRLADSVRGTRIRPGNTIANNMGPGVTIDGEFTFENPVVAASIYGNAGPGILLLDGANNGIQAPVVEWVDQYNWRAGGTAEPFCGVDVYSDSANQGQIFHGSAPVDEDGNWTLQFSEPVTMPHVTAVVTSFYDNSSEFSEPFVLGPWSCERMLDIPCAECEALVALYQATDGPNWSCPYVDVVGWLQSPLASDWTGIHVENGHVVDVWVQDLGLSGAVPWEAMAALTELRDFTAFGNNLTGTIEIAPGQWPDLEVFYLASNHLTGPIPAELGNRPNMTSIQLYKNHLTGPIPDLSQLTQLNNFIAFGNALSGQMPGYFASLPNPPSIAVMWNALQGESEVWQLPNSMPGQYAYQAVPPSDVQAVLTGETTVLLSWTPMPEPLPGLPPAPPAHYVVYLATDPVGPFEPWAQTDDQWATGIILEGLTPETSYYVQVRTSVPPHTMNSNDLLSVPSELVAAATTPMLPADLTLSADPLTAPLGTPLTVGAAFIPDPLGDHTITWYWGDGTDSTQTLAQGISTASESHTYALPGVYTVQAIVSDASGHTSEAWLRYLVVYDPEGGFVTGGGWINSPLGAYTADPSLTGKASFGFVSKYKKGAQVPTGETQFQFKAGDLDFHSESYDWLVVAGAKAKYKGAGTINGQGDYGFMISAIDAKLTPSTDVDLFRIKIWDRTTEQVVYDNQLGADEGADPTTAIGGGSIVVHK